ncbi:MAG: hypothetical protein ACRDTN_22005, partial [Mycobacterium sp.]
VWLGAIVLGAIFAPLLPLWDPAVPDYDNVFGGITPQHWLGGDTLGRDNLSRIIYGARASLLVGICAVGLGAVVGGVGNRIMGKKIIANARKAFGAPPARWPVTLHLLPTLRDGGTAPERSAAVRLPDRRRNN